MPKRDDLPPAPVLIERIEAGSQKVNQVTTELSERIKAFEEWLGRLRGRVETTVSESDGPFNSFCIRLHRAGKNWILSCAHVNEQQQEEYEIDWTRLSDASVENKMRAVMLFPKLLAQITDAQNFLVERVAKATEAFDQFAAVIGMSKKEDK